MFTVALFAITKRWEQSSVHLQMDKENVVYTYNSILCSLIKEENTVTCYYMNEP